MNTQPAFARVSQRVHIVSRCLARHDGGYLVRLNDGQAGVSRVALPEGARAVLTDTGAVELPR